MEFFLQFLAYSWRLIALILFTIILAIYVAQRNAKKAKQERQEKKTKINPDLNNSQSKKSRRQRQPIEEADDDFIVASASEGSIFDDAELFPESEADDDPLAELYAARVEAQRENPPQQSSAEDEDDVVDLASLLTGMVEDPKDYHLIADTPVAVKLVTKQKALAQELLSIFRDERDARLMVQMGDVAYRTLENDRNAKKQFATIMQELSGVIRTPDENPPDNADISGYQPNMMSPKPVDVQVSSGGDTQAREMISILRDMADNHLMIQIGNTGYRTLVGHDKAKNGFAKVMKELSQAVTAPDDNPPPVPKKQQKSKPTLSASDEPLEPSLKFGDPILGSDSDDETLPGDIRIPKVDEMPDSYEVDRFGRVKVKKIRDEDKVKPLNIAEAIEEYLQYKISVTPEFQNRGIHIRPALSGSVLIDVDGESYEFIDEVANKEAQAFIKQAIDEWQERH